MKLQKKVRHPLDRRAPAEIDDMLGIDRRFVCGEPTQRQAELRLFVTKPRVRIERTDAVSQIAHRNDRVDRTVEETDRKADDVAGQYHIEDFPLAVAKQLVANGVTLLDEAEIAILVADDDQVLALFDELFTLDDAFETSEIGRGQCHETRQPRRERMFGKRDLARALSSNIHGVLGNPTGFY